MADLAVQVVAKPLSMVTSPAMPPYAARIAMHRTSSSSSLLITSFAAFSAAVNMLATVMQYSELHGLLGSAWSRLWQVFYVLPRHSCYIDMRCRQDITDCGT